MVSAILLQLSLAGAVEATDVATLSFSASLPSSYPHTVQAGRTITVDLSALPRETTVFRAVLRPGRDETEAFRLRQLPVTVTVAGSDRALALLAPRFTAFDVTEAVRGAVKAGSGRVVFAVSSLSGYQPGSTRLDVTCTAKARNMLGRVHGLRAWHRAGQTFLTWQEVNSPLTAEAITAKEWKTLRDRMSKDPKQVRYRIYRSSLPITAATIGNAELVDEIAPLSCWNAEYYGIYPQDGDKLFRYVVEDGKQPVPPGTGIYVYNPSYPKKGTVPLSSKGQSPFLDRAGKAYYAVSLAVNGEEDLSTFNEGNSTQEAVAETVGPGEPVLQRVVTPSSFLYVDRPTLHDYVRWESPPRCNLPSRPYDYLVAVPPKRLKPAPAGLHLHCWGGNLNSGYGWWYDAAQGAILISSNQIPYDWWTGYHECLGTGKSWSDGVVRDYSQTRLLAFLDWAGTRWPIDHNRVFTAGNSMGGSGSPNFGLRHADRIAWVVSWVGVHDPTHSPHFLGSYEIVYGLLNWHLKYQDGRTPAFTYFNDNWFLRQDPAREAPLICFSNGKNDAGIGWPQARDFWKALQETRRPHVFVWGQDGHGQRAVLPGPRRNQRELGVDVRLDRTLPAFSNCSLDDNPGNGDPKDGAPVGQSNLYLYWSDAAITDDPSRWAMDLLLAADAPKDACLVDVTPRRCQRFKPRPGSKIVWANKNLLTGKVVAYGEVVVDRWGLVTVPKVVVSKGGNRLSLRLSQ
jgi:pimeloyl-ACP methyl ester carboxylesterase